MKRILPTLAVLAALLATPGNAQEYEKGVAADRRADFAAAHAAWLAAAAKGDARAQNKLGRMYQTGRGVPRDDRAAARWFQQAAERGNLDAQHSLGIFYAVGRGVPQDDILALKWLSLAATRGNHLAYVRRNNLIQQMPVSDVAEAQRLARGWLAAHPQ